MTMGESEQGERDCVFCDIVRTGKTTDGSPIVYADEHVIAIRDIAPACFHHILVLPKQHIATTESLTTKHSSLVIHMYRIGQEIMKDIKPDSNCTFGFHQPPFNSVNHLHLHCLCPPYKSPLHAMKYKSLPWFITAESLIKKLTLR